MATMKGFGFSELPVGKILGRARLIDVKRDSSEEDFLANKDKHLALSDWGNFGFILIDVVITEEIVCKGNWDFGIMIGR